MNPTNGKGSKPRPITDSDAYSKNWDRVFNDGKEWPDNPVEIGGVFTRPDPAEKKSEKN